MPKILALSFLMLLLSACSTVHAASNIVTTPASLRGCWSQTRGPDVVTMVWAPKGESVSWHGELFFKRNGFQYAQAGYDINPTADLRHSGWVFCEADVDDAPCTALYFQRHHHAVRNEHKWTEMIAVNWRVLIVQIDGRRKTTLFDGRRARCS